MEPSEQERYFDRNRRKVYGKISKPVLYGDLVFKSARALGRHLKLDDPNRIYKLIKDGEYKGKKMSYYKG